MTGPDFITAITTLGLDNHQAAQWLGVSVKSVRRYAVDGPSPGAAKAIQVEIENRALKEAIEQLGEIADVCVFGSIGRVCSYCRCDRAK